MTRLQNSDERKVIRELVNSGTCNIPQAGTPFTPPSEKVLKDTHWMARRTTLADMKEMLHLSASEIENIKNASAKFPMKIPLRLSNAIIVSYGALLKMFVVIDSACF